MTIETEPTDEGQSFAEFEAATLRGEPETPADEPKPEEKPEDELELTEDDELVEGEEEEKPEEGKKPRHKTAKDRIAELTREKHEERRLRVELEQRIAALEGGHKPDPVAEVGEAPDPDDPKYEFGEADPQFIKDTIAHGVKAALAEEKAKGAAEAQQAETHQHLVELDAKWGQAEERGAAKYEDFGDAVETLRGVEGPDPVIQILTAALSASPVADDTAYHLGKNMDTAELIIAEMASGDAVGAMRRFGEIEGQYLEERPVKPGANAHPLDHALYAGRLKAYLAKPAAEAKPEPKRVTSAPEPVRHSVRGGGGKFQVDDDTDDFAAFEKKIMGGRG